MKLFYKRTMVILFTGISIIYSSCKEDAAKKAPPPDIQVINVIQQDVPIYREFVGQVYGLLDIPIRARVEGYLEVIHFREGRPVKKGDLLYSIDSQPFLAEVAAQESRVAEAQVYLVNAGNELQRYKPLAEINAVSKSDLDAAQATKDAAEESLNAAKANLKMAQINLSYCTIKSPIDGLIGKTEARVGEFVGREPNPVILNMVSQIEKIRVQFFITESEYLTLVKELQIERYGKDLSDAEAKQTDNFELILSDESTYAHKGDFDFIDRNIDVSTGSIMIQALFPNPDRLLRTGMFAKVRVKFETISDAILVPQRCVIELQGQYSVFVVDAEGIVKARPVNATDIIGDLWLIEEGLNPSDRVVLEGIQKVRSDMKINPVVTEFQSQTIQK
jgi:membrane fusion protein (multidrug efflux system)